MKTDESLGMSGLTPSSLYHYTSQNGVLNIIKERKIWATHIRYLNDASEWLYPEQLIRNELHQILNELRANNQLRAIRTAPLTQAEQLENLFVVGTQLFSSNESILNVFVSSFSRKPDDLNQWRGYCRNGNGFCIGFDFSMLSKKAEAQSYVAKPCEYNPKSHLETIKSLMAEFKTNLEKSENGLTHNMVMLIRRFYEIAPFFKNVSFQDEQEWRIVKMLSSDDLSIDFREGKSMIVPYIEFKLAEQQELLPITEIIIGPAPHMELSQHSIKTLLRENGSDEDAVNKMVTLSKIPYRAW